MILEQNPALGSGPAPYQVFRAVFAATALDIEAPGIDRDSGVGIVMADSTLAVAVEVLFVDGFESGDTVAWSATVP